MLALPNGGKPEAEELLDEEVKRQLRIMRDNDPESPEYKFAFKNYCELHREQLDEKKVKEHRKSRVFDAVVTGSLMIATLTSEYWTPITSKWASSFMRPFHHKDTLL